MAYQATITGGFGMTPRGGITFVPITHPDTILGFKDRAVAANSEVRVTYNWGGDFTGTVINTFYPRLPNEWSVTYASLLRGEAFTSWR